MAGRYTRGAVHFQRFSRETAGRTGFLRFVSDPLGIFESMFDTGVSAGSSTACVAGLAGYAAVCRVRENIARARTVEAVCEIADIRLTDADTTTTADNTGGDPLTV
ncbi:hypothetical protein CH263_04780, partial [Rhodococcus sp. 06-1059B-a]